MKIYFTAAISLSDKYGDYYTKIVNKLIAMGHQVIHEHITEVSMSDIENNSSEEERIKYYKQVNNWIKSVDLIVAELSFPSTLNVGHEVTIALEKNKPVLGLFLEGKDSLFFQGMNSEKFLYQNYNNKSLEMVLEDAIDYCQEMSDVRFNFFISPAIGNYLDWISKEKKIPRSVYLRNLIEKNMEENEEYNS